MAHAWVPMGDGDFSATRIAASGVGLSTGGLVDVADTPASASQYAVLIRQAGGDRGLWVLLSNGKAHVSINGTVPALGIRALMDRDEIVVSDEASAGGSLRFYVSTERLAEVEPFPGSEHPVACPRCKQVITAGSLAVQCPNPVCGLWHHQNDDLPCWRYSGKCASPACNQQTRLSELSWTPEGL